MLIAVVMLIAGVAAMQWGASRAADLLDAYRGRWGLPATAGGALMGIATATPETSVNVASVAFGWPDLGLGAALGSNVPALPLAVLLSWLASRRAKAGPGAPAASPEVATETVPVQVLPYLGVVLLLGALTLPPPIAGLQWYDGVILVAAFGAYLAHALLRRPWTDRGAMPAGAAWRGLVGLPAVGIGAVVAVIGAQRLGSGLGVPDLVTGLFAIGLLCALPESYSAWRFTREGKPTMAIGAVFGDGIVSLTVALLPPAIVGAAVGNVPIYLLNLGFLAAVLTIYAVLNHRRRGQEIGPLLVGLFVGGYLAYVAATVFLLVRMT